MIAPNDRFSQLLIRHENVRLKPYLDCCGKYWRDCSCANKGKLTGGCGRNLDDVGLSMLEAMVLLSNDIARVESETAGLPWFNSLSTIRQDVVRDMVFNLGLPKFLGFQKMIQALCSGNFGEASDQMLASAWATQVGPRARELAQMMRLDRYLSQSEIDGV